MGYCFCMAENKKTTKKAAPKKGTAAASKAQEKKPAAKKPAAKKPAAKKPKTVETVVDEKIDAAAEGAEKYYEEMMDVIESVMKRADEVIPEQVTIQTGVAKSWIRRFFSKLRPAGLKKK